MAVAAPSAVEAAMRRARPALVEAVSDLAAARARGQGGTFALERLAAVLATALLYGDLLGRYQTLREADLRGASRAATFAAGVAPLLEVPFAEGIRDLVTREPRLARDFEALSRLYQGEHGFGLARAADLTITQRVQSLLGEAMARGGGTRAAAEQAIAEAGDFTVAYSENVLRTNFATVYTEGRIAKAQEPAVRAVCPALRFTAIGDSRTRPNHRAADGLVAAPDDPVWRFLRPPLGYLCRCRLDLVSLEECARLGVLLPNGTVRRATIPAGAYPDPGFRVAA